MVLSRLNKGQVHLSNSGGLILFYDFRKKPNWNVLYDLMIYATLNQEQCIKEMYAKKGWKYNLISVSKAVEEEIFDKDEDYYLLSLKVTSVQENAITELFKAMGLAIECKNLVLYLYI
jgi:hypothetical protein